MTGRKADNRTWSRFRILGEPLSTENSWAQRRDIIDRLPQHTRIHLESLYAADRTSLGVVSPSEILDLTIEPVEKDWKPEWQAVLDQFNLFHGQPKALAKLPYKFSYVFRCSDTGDRPHSAMIEDWELGVLFLKEKERLGSEEAAAKSVKKKYFNEICALGRETRFFMGTVFPYNTWVVIGVYWPPRIQQPSLF
jgi:hypothetical protein